MYSISNNGFICITRGDLFEVPLFLNRGTKFSPVRYNIKDHKDAIVYFGVMEPNQKFEEAIIRKKLTYVDANNHGDVMVKFKPSDTEYMVPGKYFYEVKLDHGNGKVETVVPKTEFIILD